MKNEFIIERHGKKYILYQGLLDEAHTRGLHSIEVELLQIPSTENDFTAISRAVVSIADKDGLKVFTEIGDASRTNVTKTIASHIIRMSATRAKARALRDAVNVGVTAYEELGVDDEDGEKVESSADKKEHEAIVKKIQGMLRHFPERERPEETEVLDYAKQDLQSARKAMQRIHTLLENLEAKTEDEEPAGLITESQYDQLIQLASELYDDRSTTLTGHEWLQREIGRSFVELSAREADKLIEKLIERKEYAAVEA